MNFSTDVFIFVFFPLCILTFNLVPPKWRIVVILIFSLVFYGASGIFPVLLLIMSSACAFYFAPHIITRKWLMWPAVTFPLMMLYLFKYLDFTLTITGAGEELRGMIYPVLAISLPAGISFYTFQIVAYLIDVYDGKLKPEKNLILFSAFISFFPQLIAGPILRYEQICSQLTRLNQKEKLIPDLSRGAKFIAFGLFAKIFFADMLLSTRKGLIGIEHPVNFFDNLYSVFSYSMVIYYDFWAYSLIAIGLGKFFSINLPRNFHEPYLSPSLKEFWRRWHTTLSFWLRDYVYFRLGGNRSYVRNILIVFFAVGIWHGAGLNFMAWGIYHAFFVLFYHFTRPFWDRLWKPLQVALTFIIVSFGWPLFYLNLTDYLTLINNFCLLDLDTPRIVNLNKWGFLGIILLWTFLMRETQWLFNQKSHWLFDNPGLWAILGFMAVLFFSYGKTFIYFAF